jgi:hypothetical protein
LAGLPLDEEDPELVGKGLDPGFEVAAWLCPSWCAVPLLFALPWVPWSSGAAVPCADDGELSWLVEEPDEDDGLPLWELEPDSWEPDDEELEFELDELLALDSCEDDEELELLLELLLPLLEELLDEPSPPGWARILLAGTSDKKVISKTMRCWQRWLRSRLVDAARVGDRMAGLLVQGCWPVVCGVLLRLIIVVAPYGLPGHTLRRGNSRRKRMKMPRFSSRAGRGWFGGARAGGRSPTGRW